MNRNVSTRVVAVSNRPARPVALRGARPLPKKRGIVGRIFRWMIFLGIVGAIVASFFVKAPDGATYADHYTIPASKWVYTWVANKISPPEETEAEAPKKDAAPSELDKSFDEAVAQREKADAAKAPEAADEAVAFLEKELEASGKRIDVIREVGIAASKSAPRKTKIGTAAAVEELAAQAATQKKIAGALAKRKSEQDVKTALAAVPPPPPPPAAPPPAPAVVPYDFKKLHAWPAQPVGTWVRWKKTVGETVSHEDHVLATLTDEAAVVRIETVPGNQTTATRVFVFGGRVVREEALKVGDAELPCRVVQSGATLRWIPKEGPGADRVALKVQTGDQTSVVAEISEEEIPVKGEAKKCLKTTVGDVTVWGHDDVPGFAVRMKTGTETAEAIEWGSDPAARPAPAKPAAAAPKKTTPAPVPVAVAETPAPAPAPAPAEEKPVNALIAEAEQLKAQGAALLREVIEAMKTPPEAQDALKELLAKAESASSLLTKSREGFISAKGKAPEPASIDETVAKLARVLELAAKHVESIKSRLK